MVECPTSAAPRSDPPSILPPPELSPLGDSDRHISRVGAGLRQSSGGARPMAPTSEDLDCRPGAPQRARAGGARPPPQAPRRSPARVPIEGGLRATECRALRLRGVPLKPAPAEERTTPTLVRRRRGILGAASLRSSYNREQSAQAPGNGDVELPNRVGGPGSLGEVLVSLGVASAPATTHGEAGASRDEAGDGRTPGTHNMLRVVIHEPQDLEGRGPETRPPDRTTRPFSIIGCFSSRASRT
jgi:hypothetical protein